LLRNRSSADVRGRDDDDDGGGALMTRRRRRRRARDAVTPRTLAVNDSNGNIRRAV